MLGLVVMIKINELGPRFGKLKWSPAIVVAPDSEFSTFQPHKSIGTNSEFNTVSVVKV